MKYIEELLYGECFRYADCLYILTSDFKNNGTRLCYNLSNGLPLWLKNDLIIDVCPIYSLSTENNLIPVREYKSDVGSTDNLR